MELKKGIVYIEVMHKRAFVLRKTRFEGRFKERF